MRKIVITFTALCIVGILVAGGMFTYNKFQEVNLEKEKLTLEKELENNKKSVSQDENTSEATEEQSHQSTQAEATQQQSQANDGSEYVEVHAGGNHRMVLKQELAHFRINRDNVFDYLIAGINQGGGDASLITFQQPIFNEQGSGLWVIEGNNKSGVGTTYRFVIDQDGTVSMYNDYDHELIDKQHVTLN